MRLRFKTLLALCVTSIPGLSFAASLGTYPMPGQWVGGAYSYDNTGMFSHCAANVEYNHGTTLLLSIDGDFEWSIGFVNAAWRLRSDADVAIQYRFDSGPWFNGEGWALDKEFIILPMPSDTTLIELFRRGHRMDVRMPPGDYSFSLTDTFSATSALAACVASYVGDEAAPTEASIATNLDPEAPRGAGQSSGSGVIVNSGGVVLTNNHVVDGCTAIEVTQTGKLPRSALLLRNDKQNDLAVLQVEGGFDVRDVATFRVFPAAKAGETIAVYGYPLSGALSVSGNIVAGNVTALSGLQDDVRFFQISAPVQPGNSGGPLMDASGNVIGIVSARISDAAVARATGTIPQNVNFAIKGSVAASFLQAHSIDFNTELNDADLSLVGIADAAKRFAVLVSCS